MDKILNLICPECKILFERKITYKNVEKYLSKLRFCSHFCQVIYFRKMNIGKISPIKGKIRTLRYDKKCIECGDIFIVSKNRKDTAKFCNRKCKHKYQSRHSTPHRIGCNCPFCKTKRGECLGKDNVSFIDGRTALIIAVRNIEEYINWRTLVFKRDNYICKECGKYGNKLEAHHIKPFKLIFQEFLQQYSQFSPFEDRDILLRLAISYNPFWDLSNGRTLCIYCHKLEKKCLK